MADEKPATKRSRAAVAMVDTAQPSGEVVSLRVRVSELEAQLADARAQLADAHRALKALQRG